LNEVQSQLIFFALTNLRAFIYSHCLIIFNCQSMIKYFLPKLFDFQILLYFPLLNLIVLTRPFVVLISLAKLILDLSILLNSIILQVKFS